MPPAALEIELNLALANAKRHRDMATEFRAGRVAGCTRATLTEAEFQRWSAYYAERAEAVADTAEARAAELERELTLYRAKAA